MSYFEKAKETFANLKNKDDLIILAIESSCDETACAVLKGKEILSNVISSQIEIHKLYGGVVPEIASRNHTLAIDKVVKQALSESGKTLEQIDAIAVTYGAGLLGALIVGVSYAKALAYATEKPLIAVNHIKGHIAVNYVEDLTLTPEYVCLIASGGHTAIVYVKDYDDIEVLGSTTDDAAGEAFDKVARVLGLSYPGGPQIEKLAMQGKDCVEMPTPFKNCTHYNFSYSGLKTAVINYVRKKENKGEEYNKSDVAKSFEERATQMMCDNAIRAARNKGVDKLVVAGGVGANKTLRKKLAQEAEKYNIKLYYPKISLCTDNAVMIAAQAFCLTRMGKGLADINLDANADLKPFE